MRFELEPAALAWLAVLATSAVPAAAQDAGARQMYNSAVRHYNAGRHLDAKLVLARLVAKHPGYFLGYSLYWQSVGKTEDAKAQRIVVRTNLAALREVPVKARTESFYYAVMAGERLLDDKDRAEKWRLEAIERLPRSKVAQQDHLDRAESERDPVQACALFQRFIEDFGENVSWSQRAARQKFERMVEHPDRFSREDIVAAAASLDRLTADFIVTYGNPTKQLMSRHYIAREFLELDPRQSIVYANRGRDFVAKTAAATDEFGESAAGMFHQVEMLAHVRLEQWEAATVRGDHVFHTDRPADQLTEPVRPPHGAGYTEADLRLAHGRTLLKIGRTAAALEQLAYAAHLEPKLRDALERALREHPPAKAARTALDTKVAAFERDRTARRKARLLATEQSRAAPNFSLLDLQGNRVELEDFRGRTLVLSFWATWCGPCILELTKLTEAHERFAADKSVAIVAVSIDAEKAKVPPFVAKKGFPFTVLYSDGTVEEPYATQSIPQLYIIDSEGRIRFHQVGYNVDHFHQHLDWMIKAAKAGKAAEAGGSGKPPRKKHRR